MYFLEYLIFMIMKWYGCFFFIKKKYLLDIRFLGKLFCVKKINIFFCGLFLKCIEYCDFVFLNMIFFGSIFF